MYRKSLQDMDSVSVVENGHSFLHRVAELPLSRATLEQLSSLYHKAQEQKLLALGLKAGESTIKLAGMVASPVISKLPVESLDHIACRQLDRLEHVVPAIKKEPNEILAASGELYNKAKAIPANTVQAVREAGINTVNGVKNYAVETVSPTLERVDKVKSYSTEKIHTATAYSKEKIDEVKSTYDGVRSGELVKSYYDSVKDGVAHRYENVKTGVVQKYEGIVHGVTDMKDGAVQRYDDAKSGIYNYASETLKPTVTRYTAVKEYGTEKVSNTYNGVKNFGTSAVEMVTENRLVKSVREGRVVSNITNSIGGLIGYMENKMDEMIPAEKGTQELSPASPEAGTWTRSMVLLSNLRGRLYNAGQQRMKAYTVGAEEMVTSLKGYKQAMTDRTQQAYQSSHDYISQTYSSARERLAYPSQYLSEHYNAGRQFVYGSYQGGIDRYNNTVERSKLYWDNIKSNMTSTKERVYTMVHTAQTNSVAMKERMTETWTSGRSRMHTTYEYMYETALFGKDYTLKILGPVGQWLGAKNNVEETEEMEMPTSVMRPISSEE